MEAWLKGGAERERLFAQCCSGYRIYRQDGVDRVAIVAEDVDMAKAQALMTSEEAAAAMKAHTVLQPLEVYVEIESGK